MPDKIDRYEECQVKKAYHSRAMAERDIERIKKAGNYEYGSKVYWCTYCMDYHIGK